MVLSHGKDAVSLGSGGAGNLLPRGIFPVVLWVATPGSASRLVSSRIAAATISKCGNSWRFVLNQASARGAISVKKRAKDALIAAANETGWGNHVSEARGRRCFPGSPESRVATGHRSLPRPRREGKCAS